MPHTEMDTLMGAYYHQDFDETGGVWGTLDLYLREADLSRIQQLVAEIDTDLTEMTEPQLRRHLVDELGCSVHLEGPDAYRNWLIEIRRVARERVVTSAL